MKSLINMIKASAVCFGVCILLSILFEFVEFPHSNIIKDFSIGAACSFIVAIICTLAQYKVEFNKAYSNYVSATSHLIFDFSFYKKDENLPDDLFEPTYNRLNADFNDFRKAESEVLYFTKRNNKKFKDYNSGIKRLEFDFLLEGIKSHKNAVISVTHNDSIICEIIDTYLDKWPDTFEKDNLRLVKSWQDEEEAQ